MLGFVKTPEFRELNVGFSMDEGMASPDDEIPLYYGERNCFWIEVTCRGSPGHGSRFLENTAAEKAQHIINRLLDYRAKEKARLENNPELTPGDVTTVNLTLMSGGVQVKKIYKGDIKADNDQTVICLTFENTPYSTDKVAESLSNEMTDQLLPRPIRRQEVFCSLTQ